jgi:hypothetical protein
MTTVVVAPQGMMPFFAQMTPMGMGAMPGFGPAAVPAGPARPEFPPQDLPTESQPSIYVPPVTDIYSARTLNTLLAQLTSSAGSLPEDLSIEIDDSILQRINLTSTRSGAHFGLLRDEGKLSWPSALQDLPSQEEANDLHKQVESLIRQALAQGKDGPVDAAILAKLRSQVEQLGLLLKRTIRNVSPSSYLAAKRFLSDLEDAVKVLGAADAAQYIRGTYSARGKTVAELLRYMSDNRLKFAAAMSGDEAAYVKLTEALAATSNRMQVQRTTER